MTKTETAAAFPPLSEWDGGPVGLPRFYDERMPGRQRRIEGDQFLLVRLTQALPRQQHGQPPPTVGELPEGVLRAIVGEVVELHLHWRLYGQDIQPIHERLDAHFRPLQEARAARQQRDAEHRARVAATRKDPWDAEANGRRDAAIWGWPTP